MSVDKLILGTAGLGGLMYGRNGRVVNEREAKCVIRAAYDAGIRWFDTSPEYGQAEQWIGEELRGKGVGVYTKTKGDKNRSVKSISRLSPCQGPLKFLWHNWDHTIIPPWCAGVTVYADRFPASARIGYGTIQVDWSILQQTECLGWAPKDGILIARSVFLQGILAGGPAPSGLAQHVWAAAEFAEAMGVSLHELALRAALGHEYIDFVVIGPTDLNELSKCVEVASKGGITSPHLCLLNVDDYQLTDPRKWAA